MPHIPDSAHPTHDAELIAAFAADDLQGRDLERARAIVNGCAECALLAGDLRAIASAVAVIPASARSRDFRLSRDDAARLRPTGVRGFLAGLSGPRFAFATPLGTAFAAIGIVGVVVASGGLPAGGGGATGGAPEAVTIQASPGVEEVPYQLPAEADPTLPQRADDANPLLLGSPVPGATDGDPAIAGDPQASMGPDAAEGSGLDTSAVAKDSPPDPLLVPAAGLVVLGAGLVLLRAGARRLA